MNDALDCIFAEYPLLQRDTDSGLSNQQNLEATPTLKELNHYITEMASSYYDIREVRA